MTALTPEARALLEKATKPGNPMHLYPHWAMPNDPPCTCEYCVNFRNNVRSSLAAAEREVAKKWCGCAVDVKCECRNPKPMPAPETAETKPSKHTHCPNCTCIYRDARCGCCCAHCNARENELFALRRKIDAERKARVAPTGERMANEKQDPVYDPFDWNPEFLFCEFCNGTGVASGRCLDCNGRGVIRNRAALAQEEPKK